jgi:hypothetical protein
MLPKESDQIFSGFKVNEEYFFENVGFEFFLIAKVRLVSHSSLSDNETIGRHLLEGLILGF